MQELIEWLREAAKTRVGGTAMINADDLLKTADMIESQAAEIGVLKIAHEAHQTSNLKMLAVLKKQAAEIENLQSLWTIAHNERSEALLELAKERSVCDQLGNALEIAAAAFWKLDNADIHAQDAEEALEAWRAMK